MALELFLTDLDGTTVQYAGPFQSTWDAIGAHLPQADKWTQMRDYYLHLPLKSHEWEQCEREMLRGNNARFIFEKILPPPYTPGFQECMHYLKKKGVVRGILSSGVDHIAHYIAQDCELDFVVCNEVHVQDGIFMGTGVTHVGMEQKGEWAERIMKEYGFRKDETAHCGDHFNDVPVWKKVGIRVGVNLKRKELAEHVDVQVTDFFEVQEYLKRRWYNL